ncbi:hypothetical protein RclHR1_01370002 [Rhizophagus clarus]|uniref:Ribonuclease H-like domain-containing protein n=1 Tax=Rhizophagus clarus TaxID=94130 RepID=A0A2Z6QAQ5_9GLOM|nr:hypothetical protein RclHR1_01370002 [Rhizophagus clarus]GES77333.1 ribonuclease H-like domain-containing protein [Rhizophagus clarus]
MQKNRKLKSTCMNCEQQGHYTKDCQNERVSNIVNGMQREVPSYNILKDIKDMRANATFGQIYNKSLRQREVNEIIKDISATWAMLKINGKEVRVIIDSGAAVSVISNNLRKKLRIDNVRPSGSSFTMANGTKVTFIRKIKIMLEINDNMKMPIIVEVMDKDREELILGNDILGKKDSIIDFENKEVRIIEQEEVVSIPIEYTRRIQKQENNEHDNQSEYSEEEYSDQKDEYESKYEEEQEQKLFGIIEKEVK